METSLEAVEGGVWDIIRGDDLFVEFLKGDYDAVAAGKVATGLSIAEHLRKLNECIILIDTEIHNQVGAHHGDLLSHATGIETLEDVLQMLQARVTSLLTSLARVKTRAGDAYARISGQTRQLARMQLVCDLMRKTARVLYLRRKIASQLPAIVISSPGDKDSQVEERCDLAAAASHLFELKGLLSGDELRGIQVVEEDRSLAARAWKEIETRANSILDEGMSTPNQSQIASALQVFSNLDIVAQIASKAVDEAVDRVDKDAKEKLDINTLVAASSPAPSTSSRGQPGRAVMPFPGNVAIFRASLWTNLEKVLNLVFVEFQRLAHLSKVLVDGFTPKEQSEDVRSRYWQRVVDILGRHFQAASSSSYVASAFESEFPKLLRFFNDLWARVHKFNEAMTTSEIVTSKSNFEADMKEATLKSFRDAYLARALSRLLDPINLMFSRSNSEADSIETPSNEEIEAVIKALQQEIVVSAFDEKLVSEVCEIVAKCVGNFAAKCEMLMSESQESSQVIGPANGAQLSNASVANALFFFSDGLCRVLATPACNNLPTAAMQRVSEANDGLTALMMSGLLPLLHNVKLMIDKIILTIHNEDFSSNDKNQLQPKRSASSPSSLYMRELNDFLARVCSDYFGLFDCVHMLKAGELKRIAARSIELFVRHAAMVRPLGDGGRLRLATDFAALEAAISPLLATESNRGGLAALGQPYRMLRACKPLLFATDDQVLEIVKGETVPGDIVLLFLFGRGPPDLRSPHQTMGWTEARFSQWMDDHPLLGDRLELTRGALESYQQQCRKKKVKEYATVYPLILQVLSCIDQM